jgi:hypothetical protein
MFQEFSYGMKSSKKYLHLPAFCKAMEIRIQHCYL